MVEANWNMMAHAQKPDFVFWRNRQVHLNRQRRQFSWLLAAEVCASAVVMLDTPCSEVVWRVLATHSICQFPLHFPSRASPRAITFQLGSTILHCMWESQGLFLYIWGQGHKTCCHRHQCQHKCYNESFHFCIENTSNGVSWMQHDQQTPPHTFVMTTFIFHCRSLFPCPYFRRTSQASFSTLCTTHDKPKSLLQFTTLQFLITYQVNTNK